MCTQKNNRKWMTSCSWAPHVCMQVDYLISFYILQPLWRLIAKLLRLVGGRCGVGGGWSATFDIEYLI